MTTCKKLFFNEILMGNRKVLKFSNEYDAKYPPPELKATYEMRKMHNLLTTENWTNKDRISEKDSEESVLI